MDSGRMFPFNDLLTVIASLIVITQFCSYCHMHSIKAEEKLNFYFILFECIFDLLILLCSQAILLKEDRTILGSQYLKPDECVQTGQMREFANYLIEICEQKTPAGGTVLPQNPNDFFFWFVRPS